jgi:RimJ/RimL family protein N-acetyltransferase
MDVRLLTVEDAEAFQAVRLRAVADHPVAFLVSYEEEQARPIEVVRERLRNSLPDSPQFGAFEGDHLVGVVGLRRDDHAKARHRAMLWGMYVAPEVRGKRVGHALIEALLSYARTMPGLEMIILGVAVGNSSARALYAGFGFQTYAIDTREMKIGDTYYDLELMRLEL